MECYYHPSRESTDNCAICNKSICKECGLEIAGKVYCKECLEKIVGMGIENDANKAPQPARLEKKEPAFERDLNPQRPDEVQFSTQRVASDSPYNIKDNIVYEGGVESSYDEQYQPRESLTQAIKSNQEPIAPPEEEYIPVREKQVPIQEEPIIPQREEQVPIQEEPIIPQREEQVPIQEEPIIPQREEYAPVREEPIIPQREEQVPIQEEPIIPQREEYIPVREEQVPIQEARNEYDAPQETYIQPPVNAPSQDYIYPDHSYEPEVTSARQNLEDKYERYLDDLYFDEEVPLNEQLARDEEKYGPLTRHEAPKRPSQRQLTADEELDNRIRAELARREKGKKKKSRKSIHNMKKYENGKEPYGAVDIALTVILVIVIIIVVFYIIYLFALSNTYPTFLDAIFGLKEPQTLFGSLFK